MRDPDPETAYYGQEDSWEYAWGKIKKMKNLRNLEVEIYIHEKDKFLALPWLLEPLDQVKQCDIFVVHLSCDASWLLKEELWVRRASFRLSFVTVPSPPYIPVDHPRVLPTHRSRWAP